MRTYLCSEFLCRDWVLNLANETVVVTNLLSNETGLVSLGDVTLGGDIRLFQIAGIHLREVELLRLL